MPANLALILLFLGYALMLGAGLFLLFSRAPRASLALILFLVVLEGSREWTFAMTYEVASFNVSVFDLITVMLGVIAIIRQGWATAVSPARGALLAIAAMTALGLVSWTLIEGLQVSVNFWRVWTLSIAACWYVASWPSLRGREGLRVFVWAACLGSLTQALGFALRGFGSSSDSVEVGGQVLAARPVTASVALLMLFGLVVLLLDVSTVGPARLGLAGWLVVSVVAAQHRSVWIASIVAGTLVSAVLIRRASNRPVAATWAAVVAVFCLFAARLLSETDRQIAQSSSDTGTFQWRIENWNEKMTVPRSTGEWLFGSAFGPTPVTERFDSALQFQVSSHNMLIDTVSAIGWVGLSALIVVSASAILRSRSHQLPALWILPVALVSFGAFYAWPPWVWFFLGLSLAATGQGQEMGKRKANSARIAVAPGATT